MLRNYFKIAFRNFRNQRMFSSLNIFGLAIGMAAVWLMVLYVADELSYDRFHEKADRIYRVTHEAKWPTGSFNLARTSAPYAVAMQNDYPEIEKTVRISSEGGGTIKFAEKAIEAGDIFFTDPSIFDVFTFPMLYGDRVTALQGSQKIVLSKSLAEKLFGKASDAVGKTVLFSNNFPNTVTGVMADAPVNSHLHFEALRSLPEDYTAGWQESDVYTYILLKNGVDAAKFEQKLAGFFPKYLKKEIGNAAYKMSLQPLTSIHLHSDLEYEISANGNIDTIYIFSVVAALILIIACINYINLYTARSMKRVREVGVRKAVGSKRTQLVAQFLTESFLMTILAGLIGALLVKIALPFFNELSNKSLTMSYHNGWSTALAAIAFMLVIGLVSGIYPAFMLSGFRPVIALKGQIGNQIGGAQFRKSLVVFQFAITVVMIACSGIVYRQLYYVNHKDLGFNKEQVLTFHIDKNEVRNQINAIKEKLTRSPLIESVAAASNPLGNNFLGSGGLLIESETGEMPSSTQIVKKFSADGDYIKTLEIKLLQGRTFHDDSPADQTAALLVNEALVKKQGWSDPLGKRIKYFIDEKGNTKEAKVIGVVADFHAYSLQHKIEPLVIQLPLPADKDNVYVRIQRGKTREALAYISNAYKQFDPEAKLDFNFLDENFAKQYQAEQKQGSVLLSFAVLAVVIACLGLFGLAAFAAEARTKEIGVRKVLGASVQNVVLLLSGDFLKLIAIAIVISIPVAVYAMQEWLKNFEYQADLSWWVFALAGFIALVIALLTVSFQAVKAALVNPVESLKSE
ncbi:ABC transporter permease [Dyadobacter fanqingshengii]|uniref:ABC transporter permease n=1 Tax=Dyadobacter fanqingshengii TaxID=2906443 RepID=A0A9X1P6T6_9BACT|nr:ABC transporter permease [Dyadobacter fanqingshengii]MCF0039401.1 ABC transporter permease [Dyadobacter fanqingshengii]USJ33785.1 ABC transporter permease [Dyadobacter fanqingshengii]